MAALDGYLSQVKSLLDDFGNVEYTTANLITYINDARVQIAGAAECIRNPALITLVAGRQAYLFSTAVFQNAPSANPGLAGVLDVRMAALVGTGALEMRPWEWFFSYYLAVPSPASGPPAVCAVLAPGISGTLWLSPIPNAIGSILIDGVCYPIPLVDSGGTSEALPAPWTEAVQYYAAYLALLNAQRRADADAMWQRYLQFEMRATQMTTPTRLPRNYPGGRAARLAGQNKPITAMPPPQGQGG